MANTEKIEKVSALRERIEGSEALLLTEYRGLTVADATELRRSLKESGAWFSVVKNTLMKRAADEAGVQQLEGLLQGPTAVAFVIGDPVGAAKKVVEAAKRFPALSLKGAFMDGRVLTAAEAQSLASLEPREAMLSKVAGMMRSEMARAASMFQALQSRLLGLLKAYEEKLPGEGSVAPSDSADATEGAADDAAMRPGSSAAEATAEAEEPPVDASAAPEGAADDAEDGAAEAEASEAEGEE